MLDYLKNIKKLKIRLILLPIYLVLLLITAYHFYYAKKIIPGVYLNEKSLGGLDFMAADKLISSYFTDLKKDVVLSFEGKKYTLSGAELDLKYDTKATIQTALLLGRSGDFFKDTLTKLKGLTGKIFVDSTFTLNDQLLENKLAYLKGEIDITAEDSGVQVVSSDAGQVIVLNSRDGRNLVQDSLKTTLSQTFSKADFKGIDLPVVTVKPVVFEKDVEKDLGKIRNIILNKLDIKFKDKVWRPEPAQMSEFLALKKSSRGMLEYSLNRPQFKSYIDSLALQVNQSPRGQVLETQGERVTRFEITQEGYEIDEDAFSNAFEKAYLELLTSVTIPTKSTEAPNQQEKYGIYALLGEGTSKFHGSIPGRMHNLALAADKTNGVLVPPGGVYSMNAAVGEISWRTGFSTAYVISNGRTVLGEGGGVCQTSTTLFRAVLNAGLPVVSRYAHAYRVHYYEEDMPVGFDAAIYQPSVDFKFKNDTKAFVLVQTSVDQPNFAMTFRLYGTPDGRKVEISKPLITNQFGPPAPLYQDDPSLPRGVVRQVDFSAWGARSEFTRTVTREGVQIIQDTFVSNYRPWRAVFLVGTR